MRCHRSYWVSVQPQVQLDEIYTSVLSTAFRFEIKWNSEKGHSGSSSVSYYAMEIGPYWSHFITKMILGRSHFHSIVTEMNLSCVFFSNVKCQYWISVQGIHCPCWLVCFLYAAVLVKWIIRYCVYGTGFINFHKKHAKVVFQRPEAHQNNASALWTAFHFETRWNRAHSVNRDACHYTMDIGLHCNNFITKVILERPCFHSIITETNYSIPYVFHLPSTDGNAVVWFPWEVSVWGRMGRIFSSVQGPWGSHMQRMLQIQQKVSAVST